jgi:hypothetical protein
MNTPFLRTDSTALANIRSSVRIPLSIHISGLDSTYVHRSIIFNNIIWFLVCATGLPDGLFSNQKSYFWIKFSGPQIVKYLYFVWQFGIFHEYLEYFVTIW